VNVYDYNIKLRKAVLGAALGFFIGLIILFRSESIITLILGIFAASYTLGVLGFLSENISGIRKLAVGIILLLPVVLLSIIFPTLFVSNCIGHAIPGHEVKKNIFTGEIKHNEYIGDPSCAELLPWYYIKLDKEKAEKEIQSYCQNHNQSSVCGPGAEIAMGLAGYH
jgi:hypothetical protein